MASVQSAHPAAFLENQQSSKSYADAAAEGVENDYTRDEDTATTYSGQGIDNALRSPVRNLHKKSKSKNMNGHLKESTRSSVIVERYQDKEGEHLVSFGPEEIDHRDTSRALRRRNSELLSGRRAGARWEQSK